METERLGVFDRNQNSRLRLALTGPGDFLRSRVRDEAKSKCEEDERVEAEWTMAILRNLPSYRNHDDGSPLGQRRPDNRR